MIAALWIIAGCEIVKMIIFVLFVIAACGKE